MEVAVCLYLFECKCVCMGMFFYVANDGVTPRAFICLYFLSLRENRVNKKSLHLYLKSIIMKRNEKPIYLQYFKNNFFYTIVLQKLPVIFLKLTRYILKVLIIYTLHTVPFNYYSIKVYV